MVRLITLEIIDMTENQEHPTPHFNNSPKIEAKEGDIPRGNMTISQLMAKRGLEGEISLDNRIESTSFSLLPTEKGAKYKIGDVLAKGGMGLILGAKDLNCRRKVAMKVMHEDQRDSSEQLLRFIFEAQVCAQLEHPGIIPVYELGVDDQGSVFYTMKLIHGETLVDIIINIRKGNQQYIENYPLLKLLNIFLRVCDAIACAHSKSVIHRDLKPENIMIGSYGEVLVLDWGLAKIIAKKDKQDSASTPQKEPLSYENIAEHTVSYNIKNLDSSMDGLESDCLKTESGQVMGTPGFMPPEQALGDVENIDQRSDIYALGGILFNILALRPSVIGYNIRELIRNIVHGNISEPTSYNKEREFPHCPGKKIPETLSAIAMKALSENAEDRYQKVGEIQEDIEKYIGGFATSVEDAGFIRLLILLIKRNKKEVISTIIALVILFAVATGFMIKLIDAKNEAEANLHKFLYEQSARKEISRKLLMTAIRELKQANPKQKSVVYRYSLLDEDFSLNMEGNRELSNIEPFSQLPLTHLDITDTKVTDISVLKNMVLQGLKIANTPITDLTVLVNLPLKHLDMSNTKVIDASFLKHLPLESLNISRAPLKDLSFLSYLPLIRLTIDRRQLRMINQMKRLHIEHLSVRHARNNDLLMIREYSISSLELHGRDIKDLTPIQNMQLKELYLVDTKIKDIKPIKTIPLNSLYISGSIIRSLDEIPSSLRTLQLERCYFLKEMPSLVQCKFLEKILIPPHLDNVDSIRAITTLKVIANTVSDFERGQTPEEFWQHYSSNRSDDVNE